MRIAILSGGTGWHVQDLVRAAAELGHVAVPLDFRRLAAAVGAGPTVHDFDGVLVRTMPHGSLEQVVFRMDWLHALAERGVPILNPPRALEACIDKYLSLARLEAAGLRVPETIVCQSADDALAAFEKLGGDVVVKPIFGSEGRGLVRVSDPELAWRTLRTIERTGAVLYVQRFIPHPGWDLRAFVLDGRILAAMKRTSNGDWRTNVAQGARAESVELTAEQESLALRAARAVGAIAAGVDLLPGSDGEWYVVEVNGVPGWKALGPTTGVDVARELISTLANLRPMESSPSIESAALLACTWEATARKAGNVHPGANFNDVTYADFLMSAAAVAPILGRTRPLGATIFDAVRATRSVVRTNTNLGIVLLLAPLANVPDGVDLRIGVRRVLQATTIADSASLFEAIRVAAPGGLGRAEDQDVRDAPTLPLRDIMALAAERDFIAWQYANDFADVFELGVPALLEGVKRFGRIEPAVQHCQLAWLGAHPDTLIVRKRGPAIANEVRERARRVQSLGGLASVAGRAAYDELDAWLRADGHARNPGTTADLVTACLFVALRQRNLTVDLPL